MVPKKRHVRKRWTSCFVNISRQFITTKIDAGAGAGGAGGGNDRMNEITRKIDRRGGPRRVIDRTGVKPMARREAESPRPGTPSGPIGD